jgi:hypothetical protein
MTDLDELKQAWAVQDRRLDETVRLNRQVLAAITMKGARSALRRMVWSDGAQAALWLAAALFLGRAIADDWATRGLFSIAVPVDLYVIVMLAATARMAIAAAGIDFGEPVAILQARLLALRRLRIRVTQFAVLAGIAMWAPFAVVLSRLMLGLEIDSPAWLTANVAFGLALVPISYWVSRRYADRMAASPFWQGMMRDVAGHSMRRALESAATLAAFTAD